MPLPLSGSDGCSSREDVVRHAIRIAGSEYRSRFTRIVLLGDAPWDLTAAASLHLPFVARAGGAHAADLRRLGAACVLADFTDSTATFDALARASEPAAQLKA